jgi:HAD superfamily hydrolase (TIGR01509 family)
LKCGAKAYLRALKAAGKKLAVATAMPPSLFAPCLQNNGIYDLFDEFLSTADAGGGGKATGRIFLLAAERLGVDPAECVVFEDVYEGVLGARRAGMRVFCVYDAATHRLDEAAALSDGLIDDFREMLGGD